MWRQPITINNTPTPFELANLCEKVLQLFFRCLTRDAVRGARGTNEKDALWWMKSYWPPRSTEVIIIFSLWMSMLGRVRFPWLVLLLLPVWASPAGTAPPHPPGRWGSVEWCAPERWSTAVKTSHSETKRPPVLHKVLFQQKWDQSARTMNSWHRTQRYSRILTGSP